jgi:hypothetical protein
MAKPGRKTILTEELTAAICAHVAAGNSVRSLKVCDPSSVFGWIQKNREFAARYAEAKQIALERMAEEVLDISDDDSRDLDDDGAPNHAAVQRARLMVDSRKWLLAKLAPKKYGDRLELAGEVSLTTSRAQVMRERAAKRRQMSASTTTPVVSSAGIN